MPQDSKSEATRLLLEASQGSRQALDELTPLVYDQLRRLAAILLSREPAGSTLQPTALVHEAYLKLIDQRQVGSMNRAQFLAIAAQEMRRVLLMHARAKRAEKRGGGARRITLDEALAFSDVEPDDLIALDAALDTLTAVDARQGRIVELRFFGELSIDETAEALGISAATVKREWTMAKAWLIRALNPKTRSS